ncbi:carbohydrate porin [Rhizobacter sp. SG703]|uniref:carbohydrate porin n=1 Tax=Rhizobacter sp. SG703 TaxID=2587140 RepID=UPI0014484C6D|nr:maltoporin [Rhizobacter sp. SG703]
MKTFPHRQTVLALAAAAASVLSATSAQAVDWGGYFRTGPGATSKDSSRACYGLGGEGMKYRLGNECDFYGEFLLSQGFKADGVEYKAALMTNLYSNGTDTGAVDRGLSGQPATNQSLDHSKLGINQMYVEGKGYDIAPNTNFWIGKRFYGRADVHIVDTFFVNLSGVGAGADSMDVGGGKLAIAAFRSDSADSTKPGSRVNVDFSELVVNPGGKLRIVGTITKGDFTDGKNGFGLTAQHNQDNALGLGGTNILWVQYAQGSAGLNGNFGNLGANSGNKSYRIVESPGWQVGPFGGQGMVMFQHDKLDDGLGNTTNVKSVSVGGRGSYALTKNFKLVAEAAYVQKKPDDSDTQKLAKFTFAPTLATGPGFWNRPELRLYVTTAKWNNAANAASGANGLTGNADGKTKGTSYGAQAEIWF